MVDDLLQNGKKIRDDRWTKSIAVGSKGFVERVKSLMGAAALGRESVGTGESYLLREPAVIYGAHFDAKKCSIGTENTYFWDVI